MKKHISFFFFTLLLAFVAPVSYQAQPPVDPQLAGADSGSHEHDDSDTLHLGEAPSKLIAQAVPPTVVDPPGSAPQDYSAEDFVNKYNGLYMALVFILGLVMKVVKVKNELKAKTALMVLSGGLIIGLIFYSVGWVKAIPLVISFLTTTGLYSSILKPLGVNVGPSKTAT